MASFTTIPPLLAPYICLPPEHSLTLLTGVLDATPSWLIIRQLVAALGSPARNNYARASIRTLDGGLENGIGDGDFDVVLVSWMRDWDFWKTEARRAVGVDLPQLQEEGRLVFVDGLTKLFSVDMPVSTPSTSRPAPTSPSERRASSGIPLRSAITTSQRPDATSSRVPAPVSPETGHPVVSTRTSTHPTYLTNPAVAHITSTILSCITSLKSSYQGIPSKVLLILDHPSLLLQTSTPSITSIELSSAVLQLRAQVYATSVALSADDPLISAASPRSFYDAAMPATTLLDIDNAAFLVGMAHQARCVISCRRLGTGWAEDVSGIVRVTKGGGIDIDGDAEVEGGEWLYHIGGDGTVKVWSRGASAG